jgi:hypothetical protein
VKSEGANPKKSIVMLLKEDEDQKYRDFLLGYNRRKLRKNIKIERENKKTRKEKQDRLKESNRLPLLWSQRSLQI